METMHEMVQRELYRRLKRLKIAIGNAERRPGVKQDELDNIRRKLDMVDYLIVLVNREDV